VFDVADSMLLLHGDAEHLDLLRVIRHARAVAQRGREGWALREPLLIGGRRRGLLEASGDGIAFTISDQHGALPIGALRDQPITGVYHALRAALKRGEGLG
jgi:hypothetical protein